MNPLHILILHLQRSKRRKSVAYHEQISRYAKWRRDRRISRKTLQHPSCSAFQVLFGSGCDQSFIKLSSFDHFSINYMLSLFKPLSLNYSPYSVNGNICIIPTTQKQRNRLWSLSALQCLVLTLSWYQIRGSMRVGCMIFGITGSVCSIFLRFGRRILIRALSPDPKSSIPIPSDDEIYTFQITFSHKYSMLGDVYAVADRLKALPSAKQQRYDPEYFL